MVTHAVRPSRTIVFAIVAWAALSILGAERTVWAQKPKPRPPAPAPSPEKRVIGWTSKKAQDLAVEAIEAQRAGDNDKCIEKDRESLRIEEHPYVKHHLAGCLVKTSHWAEAYRLEREALTAAKREDDADLMHVATSRAAEIMEHVSALKLRVPAGTADKLKITVDGDKADLRVLVDPGEHKVHAEMVVLDERFFFDRDVTVGAKEEKLVEVLLQKSSTSERELLCLERAVTLEEKQKCYFDKGRSINVHIGAGMSGYSDTTNVHVLSPAANFSLGSPTAGWNVGGSYLVDFVTAASPDIVSMASRHFRETRHAGSLGGSYKIADYTPQVNASVSSEPDYLSMTGRGRSPMNGENGSRRASATASRAIASASATRRSRNTSATSRRTRSKRVRPSS